MILTAELIQEIEETENYLNLVSVELEKQKRLVPKGAKLYAMKHRNTYQYYLKKSPSETRKTYIKKGNIKIAEILAMIEYYENLKKKLMDHIVAVENFRTIVDEDPFTEAEEKLSEGKRTIINPLYVSNERYLKTWLSQDYERLPFPDNAPRFFTRQGLRVRSKTELIIADLLDEAGIWFLYEKPLKLNNTIIHPDFTLLNMKNRKEIYWEHMGMMDDMEYRNNAFMKMREYENEGYFSPDSVIYTFETGRYPINTKYLRKMITGLKTYCGYV